MKSFAAPLLSSAFLLASATCAAQFSTPYDSVYPIIGTDGGGNTFPGATLPFGMIQWSPDTNTDAWYIHSDKQITGFGLTHVSGAGCPLYGDFAVLPTPLDLTASPGTAIAPYAAAFDHTNEQAHPGYYALTLADGIRVEITVAQRAGIARFTFPLEHPRACSSTPAPAPTPLDPTLRSKPATKPTATRSSSKARTLSPAPSPPAVFAAPIPITSSTSPDSSASPTKPPNSGRTMQSSNDAKSAQGKHTGAWLDFGSEHEVELKVGISFVSEAGAAANLRQGVAGWDFDDIHSTARQIWSRLLDRVAIEGGTPDQRAIFYTGVYHSLLSPTVFSDSDGNYIGFDDKVHSLSGSKQGVQYANYSDWDIYRNTVQFQALLDAGRSSDMMQSLVNDAVQSGWYPRWPAANDVTYVMGGDSPTAVIASSYAFGAQNFDVETALQYMVKAGTQPGVGPHNDSERPFLADYLKQGYTPVDKDHIAASRTLEYANDDFAIAQFAKDIGHNAEYKTFLKQSENWRNIFDPSTGWIRPRNSDGTWRAGFDAERSLPKRPGAPESTDQDGFEEGNTWQYSFMIPFDYPTLFAAIGGDNKVIPKLDRFFLKLRCWGLPCYNIENEPDFVVPYAYVFAGVPWKTQTVVARIANEVFKPTPDGIPGNDDLGATSGVYVWNALGFYPAVPGVGGLVLGMPMFNKATLRLSGGRTLVVTRQGPGIYVQSVTLDGAPYSSSWLPLSNLHTGTTQLEFTMGTVPNATRGAAMADRPPSFMEGKSAKN